MQSQSLLNFWCQEVGTVTRRTSVRRFEHRYEHYYCALGGWRRSYHFGLNPRRKSAGEEALDEWDHLVVDCILRHHWASIKVTRKLPKKVELWVSPADGPRSELRRDPESVGAVWTERQKLIVITHLASEVFYSMFPCLATNHFRQVSFTVRDFRYSRGKLERISFDPEETPEEDL